MDPRIDNSRDWAAAFEGAGEQYCGYNGPDIRAAHPLRPVALDEFTRKDVVHIEALAEGENDGPKWVILGKIRDGRWFYLSAGCDYTGWDCCSDSIVTVANDRETIVAFGMTAQERARLNVVVSSFPILPAV